MANFLSGKQQNASKGFIVFIGAVIAYFVYVIYALISNADNRYIFADFKVYHFGMTNFDLGKSPYSLAQMSDTAGMPWDLPYAYPPLTLYFFKPFHLEELLTSVYLFVAIKFFILVLLLLVWREIVRIKSPVIFCLLLLFAFNSTLYQDLQSANVSLIIYFLVWLGIYFFLQKNYLLFGLLIVLSSIFKLTPILFLCLLFFADHKKKYLYLAGFGGLFLVYLASNYVLLPELTRGFIENMTVNTLNESGSIYNPSLSWFIKSSVSFLSEKLALPLNPLHVLLFLGSLVTIAGISAKVLVKHLGKLQNKRERMLIIIFVFCLIYSFIMPRFKDYDYVLLLLPAYFLIEKLEGKLGTAYLLVILFSLSAANYRLPGLYSIRIMIWEYYPLFLAVGLWLGYLFYLRKQRSSIS